MPRKHRKFDIFSISFLDCICCGFGAVILLFVLTAGKKAESQAMQLADVDMDLGQLAANIRDQESALSSTSESRDQLEEDLEELNSRAATLQKQKRNTQQQLALQLQKLTSLEKSKEQLLDELKNLPKTEVKPPIQIPNPLRRQYLTDFKLDGSHVLILVESSGGMLANTPDEAIQLIVGTDQQKRKAPKWQRTVRAAEWLLGALRSPTRYQIYTYSKNAQSVVTGKSLQWLDLNDPGAVRLTIQGLRAAVPEGGANLERAFAASRLLSPPPDNIILLTDGLPTNSDTLSVGPGQSVSPAQREEMFQAARRQLPPLTPVNTVMFPLSGDPKAAAFYWRMACETQGSFVCPAESWPDI